MLRSLVGSEMCIRDRNNFIANLVNDSQHPLGSNSFTDTVTISRSLFEFGQTNTVNISASDTREPHTGTSPILTASDDHVVNVYRAFFFWTAAAAPTGIGDFQGIENEEFSPRTLTTGGTLADYYLAYPTDLGTFTAAVNGFPAPEDIVMFNGEPTVDRNGTNYTVLLFGGAQPNSQIVIT